MSADPQRPDRPIRATDEDDLPRTLWERIRGYVVGAPKALDDADLFHSASLVPFLAWVGLGADGLSSSAYGPEEAFRTLGTHTYLAVALAALTALTVLLISAAYSRIIEDFPHGGGGYVVATALLGERVGVISGCALLVDYVLTITVSVAAAGDALFSLMPMGLHGFKLMFELLCVLGLTTINVRGAKESVMGLMPIFVLFLITHAALILGGLIIKAPEAAETAQQAVEGFRGGLSTLGVLGMLRLFVHAYSLGGGTYTGIEAVSNGLPIMREPRVQTARRTMIYMATSLALTASGLLVCYLLWDVQVTEGMTLNAVLATRMVANVPHGHALVVLTLVSEGALLVVAAQAGFLDGPRVLANMAVDSWMPRRFAALSERLTAQNGIVLMGATSMLALFYTHGDVRYLVVMYSINVFATFSLSMFGMFRAAVHQRRRRTEWKRRAALFGVSFVFCATILGITVWQKFTEGGWITLAVTGLLILVCYAIRAHYKNTTRKLQRLYEVLHSIPLPQVDPTATIALNPEAATAVVLVANFGGVGIHTFLNIFRTFPGHFKNVVFVCVGVIDSGEFKGEDALVALESRTQQVLEEYEAMAHRLGVPATGRYSIGTDAIHEAELLCREVAQNFTQCTFFAGKVVFEHESWYQAILHNETAFAIQKRLHWAGLTMAILPARVR
jgi:amino acid transporter